MNHHIASLLLAFVMWASVIGLAYGEVTAYTVGPEAQGPEVFAYTDSGFWDKIRIELEDGPVDVRFLPGIYNKGHLTLKGFGHPEHPLALLGDESVVFEITDDSEKKPSTGLFIRHSRNIQVKNMKFTGDGHIGFISHVLESSDVVFENCVWQDLPNMKYGAVGASGNNLTPETIDGSDTLHIVYKDCKFIRIGIHAGAHSIYNAYGAQDVRVLGCYFEDCAGDYVRFRDLTDYGAVVNCTFKSTGCYPPNKPGHRCFIAIRTYNDVDPGDEWLGTHFYFAENKFLYEGVKEDSPNFGRYPLIVFNSGFDPPGRKHLLTSEEGLLLKEGDDEARKNLLKSNFGIDMNEFHVFSNEYVGEVSEAICGSKYAYHSPSKGWAGQEDVSSLLNTTPMSFDEWLDKVKEAVGE